MKQRRFVLSLKIPESEWIQKQLLMYLIAFIVQILPDIQRLKEQDSGLLIVKEVIELHGGQISIESHPDEGTTFTITLPKQIIVDLPFIFVLYTRYRLYEEE